MTNVSVAWLWALGVAGFITDARHAEAQSKIRREALVYGSDTRVEAREESDARLRELARHSAVSFIAKSALEVTSQGVTWQAESFAQSQQLCQDEPFDEQPVLAECSGVLVADDLVLTAGHCVDHQQQCESLHVVFDYTVGEDESVHIAPEQVFDCEVLVARELTSISLPTVYDYALIQLDRSALGIGEPAQLRFEPLSPGDALALVGNGLGLPTKVDADGAVVDPRAADQDYFTAQFDFFHRGSGSPVFDVDALLVGIGVRGGVDFDGNEDCQRLRSVPKGGGQSEEASYARTALERAGLEVLKNRPAAADGADGLRCALGRPASSIPFSTLFICTLIAVALPGRRCRAGRGRVRVGRPHRHQCSTSSYATL